VAAELQVIVDALGAISRANSGLTWIRQPHVAEVLSGLGQQNALTHEALDRLPPGRTTNYVRRSQLLLGDRLHP
jgi:hypothetical protein